MCRSGVRFFCVLLLAYLAVPTRAYTQDLPALFGSMSNIDLPSGYVDFSNGMSGTSQGWTAYGSANIGLSGPLDEDGWRLKLFGHYSQYRYETRENYICEKNESGGVQSNQIIREACETIRNPSSGGLSPETEAYLNTSGLFAVDENLAKLTQHQADRYYLGIAPGYAMTLGSLTLKAYLGLTYQSESVTPQDLSRSSVSEVWGAEGIVETWLQLGDENWFALNGTYFTGAERYSAEFKYGYRPFTWLGFGPELALYGDADEATGRAGAFIRVYEDAIETTVSGGFSGTYKDDPSVYGAANFYMRF